MNTSYSSKYINIRLIYIISNSEKGGIHIKRDKSKSSVSDAAKSKKKSGVIAGVIAGAVVVVLAVGTAAAGLYINKLDTIYPNIIVGGVNLSGLTLDEAKKALSDAGNDKNGSNVAVTVNFPDGGQMTITGEEAGLKLQTDLAAQAAFDYGRDSSFFANGFSYIKSVFTQNDLEQSEAAINESYIRDVVKDYARSFNDKFLKDTFTVKDDSIELLKGSGGGALADADALYNLVVDGLSQSVEQSSPVTEDYTIETGGSSDIDLVSIYDSIYKDPVNAVYDKATNSVTESAVGVSFDLGVAQKALEAAKMGTTLSIPLIFTDPSVTTEQLQRLLFRDVLSEKKTYVEGTSNRVNNVVLASSAINQTVLNPGDVFSYNETLGERTAAKGYREAGAYVGGQVVQEIGGGICQTSSTLYYSILYADLKVVDRSNHMFTVSYLPLGDDAAVNWGTVDFKFENNTEYPIRIESFYKDGYLTVRLLGTKTDTNRIEVKYVVLSTTEFKTVQKEDPTIEPGMTKEESAGHTGYVVESFKYIYDATGTLISKTFISKSTYRVADKVILVPVGTLTSPSPSDPGASPSNTATSPSPSTVSPSPSDESPSPSDASPSPSDASPSPSDASPSPSDASPSPSPSNS